MESATTNDLITRPSIAPLEDASADLYTADVFVSAAENFVSEIEARFEIAAPGRERGRGFHDLTTMLLEITDKISDAKGKIDTFVRSEFSFRQSTGDL